MRPGWQVRPFLVGLAALFLALVIVFTQQPSTEPCSTLDSTCQEVQP